jgi:hypothetical protein
MSHLASYGYARPIILELKYHWSTALAGSYSTSDGPFMLHIIRSLKLSTCSNDLILFLARCIEVNPLPQHTAETASRNTMDNNYPRTGKMLLANANDRISLSFFPFLRASNSCSYHSCMLVKVVS